MEIAGALLQPGLVYTFSLDVQTFLGQNDTATFQVVRHDDDVPMVKIHSNLDVSQRTTTFSKYVFGRTYCNEIKRELLKHHFN